MSFSRQFLTEAAEIISRLDEGAIESVVRLLAETRDAGGSVAWTIVPCGPGGTVIPSIPPSTTG